MFHELSKISSWNLCIAEIAFTRNSSWNFAMLWTHTKFQLEIFKINVISGIAYFHKIILKSSRKVIEITLWDLKLWEPRPNGILCHLLPKPKRQQHNLHYWPHKGPLMWKVCLCEWLRHQEISCHLSPSPPWSWCQSFESTRFNVSECNTCWSPWWHDILPGVVDTSVEGTCYVPSTP